MNRFDLIPEHALVPETSETEDNILLFMANEASEKVGLTGEQKGMVADVLATAMRYIPVAAREATDAMTSLPWLDEVESLQFAAKAAAEWMLSLTDVWEFDPPGPWGLNKNITPDVIFQSMLRAMFGKTTSFCHSIESEEGEPLLETVVAFRP